MDFSQSENMSFSTRGHVVKKTLRAGELQLMVHAQAGFGDFSNNYKHSAKESSKK